MARKPSVEITDEQWARIEPVVAPELCSAPLCRVTR